MVTPAVIAERFELEQQHPQAAGLLKDFARIFAGKVKAGESFADCAVQSAELALAEALLRARV